MEQQTLIYSFVAFDAEILIEYKVSPGGFAETDFTETEFTETAKREAQSFRSNNGKFIHHQDGHTYAYSRANGYTYCVVSVEHGWKLPLSYLERIEEVFANRSRGNIEPTLLKEQMQYCVDEFSDIAQVTKANVAMDKVCLEMEGVFYVFLSENCNVIARSEFSNDITVFAEKCIGHFPMSEVYNRYQFSYGGYHFNYGVQNHTYYGVVSKDDVADDVINLLLDRIRSDYEAHAVDLSSKMMGHMNLSNDPKQFLHEHKRPLYVINYPIIKLEDMVDRRLFDKVFSLREEFKAEDEKKLAEIISMTELMTSVKTKLSIVHNVVKPETKGLIYDAMVDLSETQIEVFTRVSKEKAQNEVVLTSPQEQVVLSSTQRGIVDAFAKGILVVKRKGGAPGVKKHNWSKKDKRRLMRKLLKHRNERWCNVYAVRDFRKEFYPPPLDKKGPSRKICMSMARYLKKPNLKLGTPAPIDVFDEAADSEDDALDDADGPQSGDDSEEASDDEGAGEDTKK